MDTGKISSAGLGSGLDVASIVAQLMQLERRPLALLEQTRSRLDVQLSAYGKLQSSMGALRDAARALTSAGSWTPTTVASSDAAAVSASSTGSTPTGSYSVSVSRLAAAQSVTSTVVPGPQHVVGTGTLTVELGSWFANPPDFTPKAGASSVSIAIGSADNTLEKVRDRINAAGAGISASIVTDASGSRLALRSSETGETNGFRIRVADDDGGNADATGLSMLAYDPGGSGARMALAQPAANAQLSINNIPVSSASNTLTDVLDGLTLRLSRTTTAPVELGVARDTEAIKKSVGDFAKAYNDFVKLLRENTAFDEATKKGGSLQGDRTAVGLLNSLRSLVGGTSGAAAAFTRLADVGLDPQRDGTLKINTSRLDAAVGRLDELRAFFSRDETGTTSDGFGTLLRQFADLALASDGAISTKQDGLRSRIDSLAKRGDALEDRLALTERRLRDQYTKLDNNMAQLGSLQAYVSQQVAQWNKAS